MTTPRLASLAVVVIVVATLARPDARQVQRDPPRTTPPPPATAPSRDATKPATSGTAILRGVVTSEESPPRPIRRAMVNLTASDETTQITMSDDDGRFMFANLPAGRFRLSAMKPGWITGYFGRRMGRGTGTTIAIADGQRLTADVTMLRGAVIAGRIVDQFGQPQAGVRPVVMELRTVGGERALTAARGAVSPTQSSTDDRGEYRIYGLLPGTYVVSATPPPGPVLTAARLTTADEIRWARQAASSAGSPAPPPPAGPPVGMAPVFYPGTSDASVATPIVLEAGAERTGIDFAMIPVPMAKVDGVVTRSDGQPAQGVQLTIASAELISNPYDSTTSRAVVSQGRFSFPAVRPGQYRITARASTRPAAPPQPPAAPPARPAVAESSLDLYAIADVTVNGRDIDNLMLSLQPATTISGRIVFEGTTLATPLPARTLVTLTRPSTGAQALGGTAEWYRGAVQPGTFSIAGVMPGRYVFNAQANTATIAGTQAWILKSIVIGGRDITDEVLEVRPADQLTDAVVTFADRGAEIAGTIFDSAGRPAPGFYVVVFPAERSAWRMPSRRFRPPSLPSTDGKFLVAGLPPGEYYIAALTEVDEVDIVDQMFLEQVAAAAIKVTLKEGEKKVQDLKIR